ncbi:NADP-dependent malic enzyme [Candidatus Saccharibacteria bacterium]|jgi:malate dehydrogenase (oxaloacetate-decarboxylating)|nr:NADP-dependent malic enzyme [Candidatus Saccharibacteria bacterium]
MTDINQLALEAHKRLKGKLEITQKDPLDTPEKLSLYYTPGVAAVSSRLAEHPEETRDYTWTNNTVAIVSDGSAVLGLGNIGPRGALPVMEGKAMLFKQFADVNAVPIVLDTSDPDEIIAIVKAISPGFGGVNLEDVKAPECFYIENELKKALKIPVFHDDQHGTAVIVLAGLINAAKVTGRKLVDSKAVVIGAGAAGSATAKLMYKYGMRNIIVIDRKGAIYEGREGLNDDKTYLASITNPERLSGSFDEVVEDSDIIIGVSEPKMIKPEHVAKMNKDSIIFAMANPVPEIMPDEAHAAGVAIMATGRSDFPNQVNNALAFPGIFRGALDNQITHITDDHKVATAEVIASLVENPNPQMIIPSVLDDRLVPAIAAVIK